MDEKTMEMKSRPGLFDNPKNIKRMLYTMYAALVALLIADHFVDHHGHFGWEERPYFFAVYGFVACVAVIFAAKGLRWLLGRREDYYER